ncbi:MAG: GNAT family N-acetyltransferase [Planctomycetota bacterium]|nr:GNAT family N-acetyltransferase [Planctomycetota bacterium]
MPRPRVVKITADLQLAAACRIVSQTNPDIEHAARRLVTASGKHGIDLTLAWATIEPGVVRPLRRKVRQACLAVLGAGRTAMMFLSEPPPEGDPGGESLALAERAACIDAACVYLASQRPQTVRIAQALPEPEHGWAERAYAMAGFQSVGKLTYLRRPSGEIPAEVALPGAAKGIRVESFDQARDRVGVERVNGLFCQALDASYVDTLDCPELCGLRATADVLDSHRATGQFDPNLWWVVSIGDTAAGCLLLNPCAENKTVELVYVGLGKLARGRGLGKAILTHGLRVALQSRQGYEVACAVDDRNVPARKLYERMGFRESAHRGAFVRPL